MYTRANAVEFIHLEQARARAAWMKYDIQSDAEIESFIKLYNNNDN